MASPLPLAFEVEGRRIGVHPGRRPDAPLIVLHAYGSSSSGMAERLRKAGAPDCAVVEIFALSWSRDMSPWEVPTLSAKALPEEGRADEWLALLLSRVIPEAERRIRAAFAEEAAKAEALPPPAWRGIGGYSLAGLFALYALYRTDAFSRAACASPSLWLPGFMDFVRSHAPCRLPEAVYFSIGSKEAKTRNPLMQTVEAAVKEAAERFRGQSVPTAFKLNPGGHFNDPIGRTAAGIEWILNPEAPASAA